MSQKFLLAALLASGLASAVSAQSLENLTALGLPGAGSFPLDLTESGYVDLYSYRNGVTAASVFSSQAQVEYQSDLLAGFIADQAAVRIPGRIN